MSHFRYLNIEFQNYIPRFHRPPAPYPLHVRSILFRIFPDSCANHVVCGSLYLSRWLTLGNSTTCRQVFLCLVNGIVHTYLIQLSFSAPLWRNSPSTSPGGHPYAWTPWPIRAVPCGTSPSSSHYDGAYAHASVFIPPCSSPWCVTRWPPSPRTRGTWTANETAFWNVHSGRIPSSRYM